jgi:molybdopterin-binding protein
MEELLQKITIYHKSGSSWIRYNKEASFRQTSIVNRNKNGTETSDNVLLRLFDVAGYKTTWNISKGDIIVDMEVTDTITSAPLTELQTKYGKESVYQVKSIDKNIFSTELDHIKVGCI